MTKITLNKQIILGAVLVGALVLAGMQAADARPWRGGPGWGTASDDYGPGSCYQARQLDDKTIAARDKFLSETVALRKEMAIKRAEQEALMNSENPDAKRIAQLTGEIFDLREQLHAKAAESGLDLPGLRGLGFGGCPGFGPGPGPGPGPGTGPAPAPGGPQKP
ncbi:MAG TPA: hypothetical protein DDY20_02970 [Desulfobulbaceae bacterium]|nr:hypothetical protein [Desulfobulbaceae bacterium]